MFRNFGRIQVALVCCFFKKRMLSKQEHVLQLLYSSINTNVRCFSTRDEVFTQKISSQLYRDLSLNKPIPTTLDRMTKVPALYKLINKFTDLWLYSFIVPSRLSSRPLVYLLLFQNTN